MSGHGRFFGVAVWHPKHEVNIGTLWRTADILGAAFLATIGPRYSRQSSDTTNAWTRIPLWQFDDLDGLIRCLPLETMLVGVEMVEQSTRLRSFTHPPRALYLLGAEDHGLSPAVLNRCHRVVSLPGRESLNLAVAGSIVIHDRVEHQRIGWEAVSA